MKSKASSKWIILIIILLLTAFAAFSYGRTEGDISLKEITDSVIHTQSPYEKCMYQCMEGHTETMQYCSPDLKDYIDNYDKYYAPYGVSTAFIEKYSPQNKIKSEEDGMKVVCFLQVVSCRRNLCKDYLSN